MFNWLPISDRKNIDSVRVQVEPANGQNYGGWYCYVSKLISVVDTGCEKDLASVLAHEYRHHIQWQLRSVPLVPVPPRNSTFETYELDIKWYFSNSPSEYDALLYQNKVAKSELSEYWLKHCMTNTR